MRLLIIQTLSVMLALAACGVPAVLPQGESVLEKTVHTEAPARAVPSLPAHGEAQVSPTLSAIAQISPGPTPAVPETTITPSAGTSVISQAGTGSPVPGKSRETIEEAVIVYHRSGGFAGVSERWAIYPDGRITTGNGRQWQVKPERVEQLLDDIQALGFFEMKGRYMPLNTCCDRFTYEITVRTGGMIHTVVTIDAAPDAPVALWQTLEEVNNLLGDLP